MLATRLGAEPGESGGGGSTGGSGEGDSVSAPAAAPRPPSIDIAALARKRRSKVISTHHRVLAAIRM